MRTHALNVLRESGHTRRYAARQTIFARGERGDSLGIIESGVVRISVSSQDGRELVLALLGPGDVIGEISVIDKRHRTADVNAAGQVVLTIVPARQVRAALQNDMTVNTFFIEMLCDRIRTTNQHAETYALNTLAGRLAIYFVNNGEELDDGTLSLADLPSQSELAKLVGVTRESVNRQFRTWKKTGLLESKGSSYVVPDPVRLQEAAMAE